MRPTDIFRGEGDEGVGFRIWVLDRNTPDFQAARQRGNREFMVRRIDDPQGEPIARTATGSIEHTHAVQMDFRCGYRCRTPERTGRQRRPDQERQAEKRSPPHHRHSTPGVLRSLPGAIVGAVRRSTIMRGGSPAAPITLPLPAFLRQACFVKIQMLVIEFSSLTPILSTTRGQHHAARRQ